MMVILNHPKRSFNGVSSSQGNNYTSEKQTTRTHLFGFFAPPHPGKKKQNTTIHSSSPLDPGRCFFLLLKVGIAKITGKAFVDGQKVLEVKEFTCDSVLSHGVFRDFVALPHRSLRSSQMFVGSLYETK